MGLRNDQSNKVCRILDDVLANRPTERDALIVAVRKAFDALEAEQRWIPVTERLPKREKTGCSNWRTGSVLVCAYGNTEFDEPENFTYEILMGYFIEMEDAETGQNSLCFVPDNVTLFIPDEWDFLNLDEDFKCHESIDKCTYHVGDTGEIVFLDRYVQILAWQPLPEPYKGDPQ